MFDTAIAPPPPPVRSRGEARLTLKARDGATVPDRLYQSGCLRVRLPVADPTGRRAEIVLINTAGGLTGGDHLATEIALGAGARATVTTPAAEKIYRSAGGAARVTTAIDVAAGAECDWLPQETILFDRFALNRELSVDLAPDACFLGLEALVFGRAAMGENLRQGALRDGWRIRRDGRLIYADAVRMEGPLARLLARRVAAPGTAAVASLVRIGPDAAALAGGIRAALCDEEGCGCSAWDDVLSVRLLAVDSQSLRRLTALVLRVVREGRPPPRVWQT